MINLTNSYVEAPKVRLGDITTKIGSGATPRGGKESYKAHGISLIRSMNVHDSTFDYADLAHLDEKQARSLDNVTVEENDVLLNITGASVARCCMVPKNVLPARVNQHVAIVRCDKKKANPFYIHYCLVSPHYKDHLLSIAQGGATREALTKEKIEDFQISLPPLPTQRKIAAILSAYHDLIENNTRRIKILEEMGQAIYREWFVHFRFSGHEKVKMVSSPLGSIPEGWEVARLADLVETQYGYTESSREEPVGPHFLRGTDINKQPYIEWDKVPYCPTSEEEHERFRLRKGDIVVIRMADPGKVAIVEKEIDAVFASYLVRLTITSPKLTPYYLFFFLLADSYQGYITGASTGTTRKSASSGVIVGTDLALPPRYVLDSFEGYVCATRLLLNNLLDKNANLRRTRDMLLPRLISGGVDVSALDIAVPEEAKA